MQRYHQTKLAFGFGLLAILLSVIRCGGGSVSIQPMEDRTDATNAAIQSLAGAADDEALGKALENLRGRRGDLPDWTLFWNKLRTNPSLVARLIPKHEDALLGLHSRGCNETAFQSFAEFVLENKTGWDHIFGQKRVCETSLGPDLSVRLFRGYAAAKPSITKSKIELEQSITLLNKEMQRKPVEAWGRVFNNSDLIEIRGQAQKLIARSSEDTVTDFAITYRSITRALPFPAILEEKFVLDPRFVKAYAKKRGQIETASVMFQLIGTGERKHPELYTLTNLSPMMKVLTDNPFGDIEYNWQLAWDHYTVLKRLILHSSTAPAEQWPLIDRLKMLNKLQVSLEKWWTDRNLSDSQAEMMVAKLSAQLGDTPEILDLAWFSLRLLSYSEEGTPGWKSNPYVSEMQARVDSLSVTFPETPDRVLAARLKVHFAPTTPLKKKALVEFCALFPPQKNIEDELRKDLSASLIHGVPPGCFNLSGSSDIAIGPSLTTTFDTALILPYRKIEFAADQIELGIIDQSEPSDVLMPATGVKAMLLGRIGQYIGTSGGRLHLVETDPSISRMKRFAFISQGSKNPTTGFRGLDGMWDFTR